MSSRTERFDVQTLTWDTAPQGAPPAGVLWVLIHEGHPEAVEYVCPCGCGQRMLIYVKRPGEPPSELRRWDYQKDGLLISPSVRHDAGCLAHYCLMSDGKVMWA